MQCAPGSHMLSLSTASKLTQLPFILQIKITEEEEEEEGDNKNEKQNIDALLLTRDMSENIS